MADSRGSTIETVVLVVAALVALGLFVGLFLFLSLRSLPGEAVDAGREVLADLTDLAAAFREGTTETQFVSYAAEVSGSRKLQVAELEQTEIYTRTDSTSVLWGSVALPDVVVEARVPVQYVYFVDLDKAWDFELREGELMVRVPELEANRPALDVSSLYYVVRESSVFRDETEAIEALQAGLTRLSRERAREHKSLVRETAREQIERFVAGWLANAFAGADTAGIRPLVVFPGEEPPEPLRPVPPLGLLLPDASVRLGSAWQAAR